MSDEKKASEILAQQQTGIQLSLQEVLENYKEVELTNDEITEAMIWAKRKKIEAQRLEKQRQFEEENIKLKSLRWDFNIIRGFMIKRAENIFGFNKNDGSPKFQIDEFNEEVFNLLSYYFIDDETNFSISASKWGVANPSVKKGILLAGVYGCGKTWMMKLFSRNKKQSFEIVRAKEIAEEYLTSKEKQIPKIYLKPIDVRGDDIGTNIDKLVPSAEVFNQRYLGLCIDDLGSEAVQNNFGNKMNVIGDLIESRYSSGFTGVFLHGTTNLSAQDLKAFYGGRVSSRLREIFNLIELPGSDRRK